MYCVVRFGCGQYFCIKTMYLGDSSVHYLEEISPGQVAKATKVFVNGPWVVIHYQVSGLCQTLRSLRRKVDIHF